MSSNNSEKVLQENRKAEDLNQPESVKQPQTVGSSKLLPEKTTSERRDATSTQRDSNTSREEPATEGSKGKQGKEPQAQYSHLAEYNMAMYHMPPPTYGHTGYPSHQHQHMHPQGGNMGVYSHYHPSMHQFHHLGVPYGSFHAHHPAYAANYLQQQQHLHSSNNNINNNKKRTIDGISDLAHQPLPSHAYSFRRTDSNCSSTTAATTNLNNNHSMDNSTSRDDSPVNGDSELPSINMGRMGLEDRAIYPSVSHDASIASSFTIGDISMTNSFEQQQGQDEEDLGGVNKRQKQNSRKQLSVDTNESGKREGHDQNIFLTMSTSPITAGGIEATPSNKHSMRALRAPSTNVDSIFKSRPGLNTDDMSLKLSRSEDFNDDHHLLNHHLRGQTFTPLPNLASYGMPGESPSAAFLSGPHMSWNLPEGESFDLLDDLRGPKTESKSRPNSTTSLDSRKMSMSPRDFKLWKDDMIDNHIEGTSTPLPAFFEGDGTAAKTGSKAQNDTKHTIPSSHELGFAQPPTPFIGATSDMMFSHSPHHQHQYFYGSQMQQESMNEGSDRVRNLRGRMHPCAHFPMISEHFQAHMHSHLPMTSPMALNSNKQVIWSPGPHPMAQFMASPHHMASPLNNLGQSKRKCVPLKPPIPTKFQGDLEKNADVLIPDFTSLINFPQDLTAKEIATLPEGIRCCVMCGRACPFSNGMKKKKTDHSRSGMVGGNGHSSDNSSTQAVIPSQNKGLCTLCDVNVWIIAASGIQIKWCKGCKNFRPWAGFGDKGLATKCCRCRDRQREKYAIQKEMKERSRTIHGSM